MGIGNFGEFATFSFEQINQTLIRELKRKHQTYTSEDVFAEYKNIRILGVLRIYSPTKIGKRPQKYSLHIVSPENDIGLNIDQLRQDAQKKISFSDRLKMLFGIHFQQLSQKMSLKPAIQYN